MVNHSRFVIGVLIVCMAIGPHGLWAAYGPCTVDREGEFLNTIACNSGVCTGMVQIRPVQSSCSNETEEPCSQDNDAPTYITYQPETTDNATLELLTHLGLGAVCAVCVIGVAAVTGLFGPAAEVMMNLTCGATCAAAFYEIDGCLFTTCTQDLTTRFVLYGGHAC